MARTMRQQLTIIFLTFQLLELVLEIYFYTEFSCFYILFYILYFRDILEIVKWKWNSFTQFYSIASTITIFFSTVYIKLLKNSAVQLDNTLSFYWILLLSYPILNSMLASKPPICLKISNNRYAKVSNRIYNFYILRKHLPHLYTSKSHWNYKVCKANSNNAC